MRAQPKLTADQIEAIQIFLASLADSSPDAVLKIVWNKARELSLKGQQKLFLSAIDRLTKA
jgi:hypothetical protein